MYFHDHPVLTGLTFATIPLYFAASTFLDTNDGWSTSTTTMPLPLVILVAMLIVGLLILLYWLNHIHRQHQRILDEKNQYLDQKNRELEASGRRLTEANAELTSSHQALTIAHCELESSNAELNRLYLQLQEATSAREKFFINVSHDLRTPLTLISEPVDQLMQADNLTDKQRVLVNLAHKNVRILLRMINQILDFGKLENQELVLTLKEVDVRAAFNEWGSMFRSAARSRNIAISFDVVSAESYVMAVDVEKVEHIFFNLMSNALKFTPSGGHIWVRLEQENVKGKDMLKINVTDDGAGMSPEVQQHIFDRFYTADSMHASGSGIGLVLVKAFVELHDGRIAVHSEVGHGSSFTVSLPVRHVQAPTVGDAAASFAPQDNSDESFAAELARVELPDDVELDMDADTVLIIDDNQDMRTLLHSILSPKYTILQASGGAQGFKMAMKYLPMLIVCDVVMPGIDGLEVCRRLKKESLTAHIPVLLLTACALDEQRIEGYACGADAYISKPFDNRVLLSRCEALIANRRTIFQLSPDGQREVADVGRTDDRSARVASRPMEVESDFYRTFLGLVDAEIGNPDLSVVDLAARMGLSRVQFYRKIKALTNYAPAELLRIIRLKRADSMLKTTEQTVAEISYAVGFSSPSYFARCYRDYFGASPTEVQERTSKIS